MAILHLHIQPFPLRKYLALQGNLAFQDLQLHALGSDRLVLGFHP